MRKLTIAICTYNRAQNLPRLVEGLRKQISSVSYELLFINNNSTDNTEQVLKGLALQSGIKLRSVIETQQGIVFARNRALNECMEDDYMLFMDDDELPASNNMVENAVKELEKNDVLCVGGKVAVDFGDNLRPKWLVDELLGFYAEIDYGDEPFLIKDDSTPIWTSIIAYNMTIFRNHKNLRFDGRYNRVGIGVGGGSDAIMFRNMLDLGIKMKYLPGMSVLHFVEPWRMTRLYFWRLHFISGRKKGFNDTAAYKTNLFGVPPFLMFQFTKHLLKTLVLFLKRDRHYVRQGMNTTHSLGMIYGRYLKFRNK